MRAHEVGQAGQLIARSGAARPGAGGQGLPRVPIWALSASVLRRRKPLAGRLPQSP